MEKQNIKNKIFWVFYRRACLLMIVTIYLVMITAKRKRENVGILLLV